MKYFCFLFFLFISIISYSQSSFSKEFSLLSDNDLYTSTYRDRYYTNGLFLNYRVLAKKTTKKVIKKINSYQIGHMMYTPTKATLPFASTHDRPFAGFFYFQYGQSRFFKNEDFLITDIQLGVIGSKAKGEDLQNFIHGIYNYPEASGWTHQIKNAIAINLNGTYIKRLSKLSTSFFDLNSQNQLKIGTIFTDISSGIYSRIGLKKLQPLNNSAAFNSNLNNGTNSNQSESFFFINPKLSYVFYDATIQGSFLNKNSPVTFEVKPIVFSFELGYKYYYNRFLYGYTFHFHTKKLKSSRASNSNSYGGIYIGYYIN